MSGKTPLRVAKKRLLKDFRKLQADPPTGISGAPIDTDIMRWHAVIFGCVPPRSSAARELR